jgi:subtilisin
MSDQPSFSIPASAGADETTGKFVVTFRDEGVTEGLAALKKHAGISKLPSAADFAESALELDKLDEAGGAVFPTLGVAVVTLEDAALAGMMAIQGEDSAVLSIEPERIFYALGDGTLPLAYLRGYHDAVSNLYEKASAGVTEEAVAAAVTFSDDSQSTWGLKATRVVNSRFTGRGIKVAVLDTGMDLQHPDFRGRAITSRSFITGEAVQDRNGHGTHCIGTACGFKDLNGRRYGVAHGSSILAGKVLSNAGSGATSGILAGMEWAIVNGCQVISMSLGNTVSTPSTAYETVGRRALQNGCLIVAAAGNHGPGPVGQPANSPSIMAVAALNNSLQRPSWSSPSGPSVGANVDISGPGVAVYSSVPDPFPATVQPSGPGRPWPPRYHTISGTSMATPHVAGIAALYAEAFRARGSQLWQLLVSRASRLPLPTPEVGAGLVQAPS